MKNNFFKLPFLFDGGLLLQDLETAAKSVWSDHFNQKDYDGKWTSISLRSASGKETDIYSNPGIAQYSDTPLLKKCPYFQSIIDLFKCETEAIRLLSLAPGSNVKEHRDNGLSYRFGEFRLHIPIVTDAAVEFMVAGENIPMKKGECWYADFDLPHSVRNDSKQERIHLVMDAKRNAWTDELFAAAGYDFEAERKKNDHSVETKKQMIEQLRYMKTPVAEEMIKKLEQEIAAANAS